MSALFYLVSSKFIFCFFKAWEISVKVVRVCCNFSLDTSLRFPHDVLISSQLSQHIIIICICLHKYISCGRSIYQETIRSKSDNKMHKKIQSVCFSAPNRLSSYVFKFYSWKFWKKTNFLQKERNIITHLFLCNLFLIAAIYICFVFYLCLLYCKFLCIYFCRVPSQQCPHFVVGFICSRLDCICCLASRVLQICKICSSLYPVANVEVK